MSINKVKSFEPLINSLVNTYFEILTPEQRADLVLRYMAMIYHESRGDNSAVGDGGKSYGLGQIYLPTFNEINQKYFSNKYKHSDILGNTQKAEELNLNFGVLVLKEKYKSYAYVLSDWAARLDMITKRYNGSGSKAEQYLLAVKEIEQKYFKKPGGTAPTIAGGNSFFIFLIAGLAVSFFFRR